MENKKNIVGFAKNVLQEKCPNCKVGATFKKENSLFAFPKMYDSCSHCNYKFEREPGYFIGAMYISYGLAIAQSLIVFTLTQLLLPPISVGWILCIQVLTLLIFAKSNYKWSRVLYIYIFPW
ncbi:DUF983 domain-containing protein [Peijinzhouia sedimentorum]